MYGSLWKWGASYLPIGAVYTSLMLPTITVELVQTECDAFDLENELIEEALRQLRTQFPHNTEAAHVFLKVVVLNQLYNTRINNIDVEPLARRIAGIGIDALLDQGSFVAVDRITICPPLKRYLSFASKFCSWHNPAAYPIYDRNARTCLWAYRKQDKFAKFQEQDLWVYADFCAAVTSFSSHYGLGRFNLKQLDKLLYRVGGQILQKAGTK